LPFECDFCKKIYCLTHRRADDHNCNVGIDHDAIYVIICPICRDRIKMRKEQDANIVFLEHTNAGKCKPEEAVKYVIKKCMAEKCNTRLTEINIHTCL
jgi:hypothetical protein